MANFQIRAAYRIFYFPLEKRPIENASRTPKTHTQKTQKYLTLIFVFFVYAFWASRSKNDLPKMLPLGSKNRKQNVWVRVFARFTNAFAASDLKQHYKDVLLKERNTTLSKTRPEIRQLLIHPHQRLKAKANPTRMNPSASERTLGRSARWVDVVHRLAKK